MARSHYSFEKRRKELEKKKKKEEKRQRKLEKKAAAGTEASDDTEAGHPEQPRDSPAEDAD